MRDVLLGVTLPQFTDDPEILVGGARRAEECGLDSIWAFDHLWPLSGGKQRPVFECWTALAWAAEATRTVRIGPLVTRSSLRHPVLLAKSAATVGAIAQGRLIVALGSGDEASRAENEAFGIPYWAEDDRIDQLASTATVLTRYLEGGTIAEASARFATVRALPASPTPAPRPPVWLAGRSGDVLELTGRMADGWNGWGGGPKRFAQDAALVAEAAGDRSVELSWGGIAILGRDADAARAKLGSRNPAGYVVGGPTEVARRLGAMIEAGARHVMITLPDAADPEAYELLGGPVARELGLD